MGDQANIVESIRDQKADYALATEGNPSMLVDSICVFFALCKAGLAHKIRAVSLQQSRETMAGSSIAVASIARLFGLRQIMFMRSPWTA